MPEITENKTQTPEQKPVEQPKAAAPAKAEGSKPAEGRKFDKNQRGGFNKPGAKRAPRRSSLGDNFEERVRIKRISKTTKGGRHMRFSALVIVGDRNGKVGFGIGKANETPNAIRKAIKNARKSLVTVRMTKSGTLYHEIVGREGASKVLIKPAPAGTGIIAGGVIRDVIELAGFKDAYTKKMGSNCQTNMVTAIIRGLKKQLTPDKVLRARDKYVPKKQPQQEVKKEAPAKAEVKENQPKEVTTHGTK